MAEIVGESIFAGRLATLWMIEDVASYICWPSLAEVSAMTNLNYQAATESYWRTTLYPCNHWRFVCCGQEERTLFETSSGKPRWPNLSHQTSSQISRPHTIASRQDRNGKISLSQTHDRTLVLYSESSRNQVQRNTTQSGRTALRNTRNNVSDKLPLLWREISRDR